MVDATGTTTYTYDAASQLSQFSGPTGTVVYGYNNAGQRATSKEWLDSGRIVASVKEC